MAACDGFANFRGRVGRVCKRTWRPATGLHTRSARIACKPVAGRHEGARFPRTAAFRFANPSYTAISDVLLSAWLSSGLQTIVACHGEGRLPKAALVTCSAWEVVSIGRASKGTAICPDEPRASLVARFAEAAPLSRLSGSSVRLPCVQNDGFHEEHCMVY